MPQLKKSRIRETKNLSTDADSRTDTILERLRFFVELFKKKLKINHATSPKLYRSYYPHRLRDSLSPVCGIFLVVIAEVQIGPTMQIMVLLNCCCLGKVYA